MSLEETYGHGDIVVELAAQTVAQPLGHDQHDMIAFNMSDLYQGVAQPDAAIRGLVSTGTHSNPMGSLFADKD